MIHRPIRQIAPLRVRVQLSSSRALSSRAEHVHFASAPSGCISAWCTVSISETCDATEHLQLVLRLPLVTLQHLWPLCDSCCDVFVNPVVTSNSFVANCEELWRLEDVSVEVATDANICDLSCDLCCDRHVLESPTRLSRLGQQCQPEGGKTNQIVEYVTPVCVVLFCWPDIRDIAVPVSFLKSGDLGWPDSTPFTLTTSLVIPVAGSNFLGEKVSIFRNFFSEFLVLEFRFTVCFPWGCWAPDKPPNFPPPSFSPTLMARGSFGTVPHLGCHFRKALSKLKAQSSKLRRLL